MLLAKLHDDLHLCAGHHVACRVPGVDDDHGLDPPGRPIGLEAGHRCLHLVHGHGPSGLLIQIVSDGGAAQVRQGGGVQRVLGNRDEHAIIEAAHEHGKRQLHRSGGAICQVDGVGINRRETQAVSTLDELGNLLPERHCALGVRVGAESRRVGKLPRALMHIGRVERLVVKIRVRQQRQDLPVIGHGLLPERLRVADVAWHDLAEWEVMILLLKLIAQILRQQVDLAPHSILHLDDICRKLLERQAAHHLGDRGKY
mmetsp:Transcript_77540/g.225056  ORF Transcript_77540/g.225056 Transcript_77540/m.225056 type:complete len:257 (+) Transcript_77540:788-1558(+)